MYVIYALVDPRDNTVHYVGCTQNVYDRFIAHIQCSGNNYAKNAWIHELRTINKMVIMETLEEIEDRQQAEEREA
jgi:predicted GIY-YIG superfamily endonuclease